jgi:ligand-binding sensor domain-containing protein/two-component sensor histidine kinase
MRRVCVLASLILVAASMARAERLPIRTYTTADGLTHVRVTRIVADSRGFVWFCAPEGLSRFDGQGFTRYGHAHGLANTRINDFLETSRGTYWVATNGGGVYRYTPLVNGPGARDIAQAAGSRFTLFRVGEDAQTNRVNDLHEDRQGRLWAGTDGGLFQLDDAASPHAFRRVSIGVPASPDRAVQIWAFADDHAGGLWIGTSRGLLRRHADGRVIHSRIQPGRGLDNVRALLVDRKGRLWIGHDSGLILFRPGEGPVSVPGAPARAAARRNPRVGLPATPGETVRFTTIDGVAGGNVRALLQSADGQVWIGSRDGLTRFDGHRFESFTSSQGITRVTALTEDREGSIWIGTLTNGAQRLARHGFSTYTEADGLRDTLIGAVFEAPAGRLHVVSSTQHVHRLDAGRFVSVRPNLVEDVADPVGPGTALRDRAGEWWMPGGAGLYRFPKVARVEQLARTRPRAIYTSRDGLAGDDVFRLFEDSRGDIWIGRRVPTSSILTRWERATGAFHRYTESDGLPPYNRIYSFAEDRSGNVWIGFQNGGVARLRHGRFTLFTAADGAPAEGVGGLLVDARGRLWIGSTRPALTRVDDPAADRPRFRAGPEGLSAEAIGPMTEDLRGRLYLGTTSGVIDRLDPQTGRIRQFTAADGLPGTSLTTAFRDSRGAVWFGSYNGLIRLLPGEDPPATLPAVRIGSVRVAGESYLTSDLGEVDVPRFELGAGLNHLQFEFFALGAGSGDAVRYQYRLDGADRGWNAPTDHRDVNYASLAPGQYRFLVRTVASDGTVNHHAASVEFTIVPPIWQRWWFRGGLVLAVVVAVLAGHRYRVRHLLALERIRMRIAADLHDDIGGSLSRIAIQSEVARREAAALGEQPVRRLSDIAESARGVVDALGDVVWSVDPRRDDLASVFRRIREYGDELFAGTGVRWAYHASGNLAEVRLDPQARRQLFLLVKEATTNAARHAAARSVTLRVELSSREFRLDLEDDGRGFAPDSAGDGGDHHGIASMRSRAERLGSRLTIVTSPGTGTTVSVRMPRARGRMIMLLPRRLS